MYPSSPDKHGLSEVGIGAYDRLYARRDLLWPEKPGRMVSKAASKQAPGRALDAGCGDGKNSLYLLRQGWTVDAFDISSNALDACNRRLEAFQGNALRIWRDDCRLVKLESNTYDMIVAYGLYHCLDDAGMNITHKALSNTLRVGGMFVFASFNNRIAVPADHNTGKLYLRPHAILEGIFHEWKRIELEVGVIYEDHAPLVGVHQHSLTWAVYEKLK